MGVAELTCNGWEVKHPKCPQHSVLRVNIKSCFFIHSVSLFKEHKSTHLNSSDKEVDLFYWIMLGAPGLTQSLLLVTPPLEVVLPVEKMLVSGVMVSDNYNPVASVGHILHLYMYRMYIAQPRNY